jgi:membrane protease YdiL (CAAX protease family)
MELRGQAALLTAEVVAVIACALAPLPGLFLLIALFAVASISLYVRGQTWAQRCAVDALRAGIGVAVGATALGLALVVVGPLLEARTGGMVNWSQYTVVRGQPSALVSYAVIVTVIAVTFEAILRGWVLERVRELAPSGRRGVAIAIAVTAVVEGVLAGGTGWSGVGAAIGGVAASALYLASGRSLVAPVAARLTFDLGALVLEALKVVN